MRTNGIGNVLAAVLIGAMLLVSVVSFTFLELGASSPLPYEPGSGIENIDLSKLSIGVQRRLGQMSDSETMKIIVRLESADLGDAMGVQAVDVLKRHAERTQGRVIDFLSARGAKILNRFWLTNAILAEVKVGAVRQLTSLPAVRKIHEDFRVTVPEPGGVSISSAENLPPQR